MQFILSEYSADMINMFQDTKYYNNSIEWEVPPDILFSQSFQFDRYFFSLCLSYCSGDQR